MMGGDAAPESELDDIKALGERILESRARAERDHRLTTNALLLSLGHPTIDFEAEDEAADAKKAADATKAANLLALALAESPVQPAEPPLPTANLDGAFGEVDGTIAGEVPNHPDAENPDADHPDADHPDADIMQKMRSVTDEQLLATCQRVQQEGLLSAAIMSEDLYGGEIHQVPFDALNGVGTSTRARAEEPEVRRASKRSRKPTSRD